ncbi:hypothetical protein DOY81_007572 [Sarcophaga bullata]|nr:hypothetical protein DOY81_007572 [Sarcophaga bullata]
MSSNSTATSGSGSAGAITKVKTKKVKSKHKEEEAIELPKVLDYLFEKELINRQNKRIHIMDTFGPSRNTHHLTSKFYARHEQQTPDDPSQYVSFVCGSSYKHNTESNVYGWMPDSVNSPALLKQLNFINAPKQRCCLTKYGEILESDKANARPQFNGLRFFLQ